MKAAAGPIARTYRIVHTTRYDFDDTAGAASLRLRLRPRDLARQRCEFHQTVTRPLRAAHRETSDRFGNTCLRLEFAAPLQALEVSAISRVRVTEPGAVAPDASPPWEQILAAPRARRDDGSPSGGGAAAIPPIVRERLVAYASTAFRPGRPVLAAAEDLMQKISVEFVYDPNATDAATTVAELLVRRRGVCQDFASVLVASLRAVGLAARYVSGYVDGTPDNGRRAIGANAPHAWCEVGVPGLGSGWFGLDPTRGRRVGVQYVTLAWGRDYDDVAPVTGVVEGAVGQRLAVCVDVERLADEDRAIGCGR